MTRRTQTWLLATTIAAALCLGTALEGPSDLDVAQAVADDHTAVQQAKLVLAGNP